MTADRRFDAEETAGGADDALIAALALYDESRESAAAADAESTAPTDRRFQERFARLQLSLDGDVQVRWVSFDPSGSSVAVAGRDGVVLIDTGARREIGRLPHPAIVQTALYRNADELVASCQDGALRVWSLKDRKVVREVRPGEAVLRNMCLSRDGRLAAVRGFRRLFVIELDSMRIVASLAQRDEYGYLAFLGNDRTLLAWFDDQEGWIWNTESWQAMGELSVLRPLSHVRASADGFRLVTTGDEFSLVDATPLAPPPRAASNTAAN
ncbi:MAG: hypothetical protein K2Y37_18910 [Pirellulales bacterium]|nr:hypothetical protein [Pirellulales bacterium]